ncbi:outer membrane beta-barrel protein [Granulicella tundricola]
MLRVPPALRSRSKKIDSVASRPLDLLIGGWQLNNLILLSTVQPVDLSAAGSAAQRNRPDLITPIRYLKSISGFWFDPTAFSSNIPVTTATDGTGSAILTRIGTLGSNQVYGPAVRTVNLGVQRNSHLTSARNWNLTVTRSIY